MRVKDKVAVVVGGGQTPGATMGNGRATAIRFAQEGAKVVVLDRHLASAAQTVEQIEDLGFSATAMALDVTKESQCQENRSVDYCAVFAD